VHKVIKIEKILKDLGEIAQETPKIKA